LRTFWERVSGSVPVLPWLPADGPLRAWANDWAAAWGAALGLRGFFVPRPEAALPPGGPWAFAAPNPSYYDTAPLRATLEEFVDFDLLNGGGARMSVGAVDVESGNFVYFDNATTRIGPEHVMASGALPPGFPALRIDGRWYWDGGLVSNTPLRHVVEAQAVRDATIFQVDLFSARGAVPHTLAEVNEREKDIRFASRTRAVSDVMRERHEHHRRLRALAAMLPAERRADPRVREWLAQAEEASITLVHLIHRGKRSETQSKDYEFSHASMLDHWEAGRRDTARALEGLGAAGSGAAGQFRVFDFGRPADPNQEGARLDRR